MADLTAANQARLEKSLNQIYRFSEGVMRLKEYLEKYTVGYESSEVAKYEYNRHKFNAMGPREQAEYEEKLKERKISYRAMNADGSFINVPKIVFEHFTEEKK